MIYEWKKITCFWIRLHASSNQRNNLRVGRDKTFSRLLWGRTESWNSSRHTESKRACSACGTDNLDEREQALIAGPGQVNSVAPQLTYREIREKYSGFNNYQAYFSGETSYIGQIYRQQAVFQRFSIIYPELTTYLFELEAEYYDLSSREQHLDSFARPNTIQEIISSSYDYMREQLDIDDMYVRDAINKGDDQYLTS